MPEPSITIVEAMRDPELFGPTFGGDSWSAWRALLGAFYGLSLTQAQAETVNQLTDRSVAACTPFRELWMPIGRRGGKSHVASLVAVYEAAFKDHTANLSPGEWATVALIAADRAQARTLLRYVRAMFEHPLLKPLVIKETAEGLELRNRAAIEVHTASFRKVRGYTLAAVIADEIAFWMAEGRSPDVEIISALRPALATLDGRLVAISSPYARRGALWDEYRKHYGGTSDRVLVAQAPSRKMNPTLRESLIESSMRDDAERASAEYLAQFRTDISTLLSAELIEDATRRKPMELPPDNATPYLAFVDPAGGGADEFTMSIAHNEGGAAIIDLVQGRKGSPAGIVAEYAEVLRRYGITRVTGDKYAGRWPRDEFAKHGIAYDTSDLNRSGLYLETLAALNSGRAELPPDEKMARQFAGLERRTSRSGRDAINHGPGGHDDRANAVAGAITLALKSRRAAGVLLNRKYVARKPQTQEKVQWSEPL